MPLDVLIEGLLFYKSAPQKVSSLKKLFAVGDEEWNAAIEKLKSRLEIGATCLIETESELQLVTAPTLSNFIETLQKSEQKGDIGKAGAETLAIVLYREPIGRAEIDRIRGVNSSFILRNLLIKGLITRESSANGYQFKISSELLQHLGVPHKQQLPRYSEFMDALDTFNKESV